LSRWCSPIDGSSSTYITPVRPGADLRGQPDALRLAAGKRLGRAVQRQVVQADVVEEPQPVDDLAHDPLADGGLGARQLQAVEAGQRLPSVQRDSSQIGRSSPRGPTRTKRASTSQPGAVAGRAGAAVAELGQFLAHRAPSRSRDSGARGWATMPSKACCFTEVLPPSPR
jgi:hypothetical protein